MHIKFESMLTTTLVLFIDGKKAAEEFIEEFNKKFMGLNI